ncbi:MAG: oligosaccharide flippase family protein [Clostridia bacterium]
MKKSSSFVRGFLWLAVAGIVCKAIGALHRIPLTNILGAEGIGMYQMIFPIFAFVLILSGGALSVVASREIASLRAKENFEEAKKLAKANFVLSVFLGTIFALILFLLSFFLASIQGNTENAILFQIASLAVLVSSVGSGIKNIYVGFEKMSVPAISQITQQGFKLIFGLLFATIFVSQGLLIGVAGAFLGVAIGEIACLIYLTIMIVVQRKKLFKNKNVAILNDNDELNKKNEKTLIKSLKSKDSSLIQVEKRLFILSLPVLISLIILPLTTAVESLVVVKSLTKAGFILSTATAVFGIWSGVICSLVSLPTVIASSVSTAIVPSVGYSLAFNKNEAVSNSKKSITIVWIFSSFCAIVMFVLAPEILKFLYSYGLDFGGGGGGTQLSINILRFSCLNIVLLSLLQCTISLLQAYGKTKRAAVNLATGAVVKNLMVVSLVQIPFVNIWGCVVGTFILFLVSVFLNFVELNKFIKKIVSFKLIFVSIVGLILAYLFGFGTKLMLTGSKVFLVIAIVGTAMFFIFAPFVYYIYKKSIVKT